MEDKSASLQAPADAAAAAAVCPYRLAAFLSLLGFVLLFCGLGLSLRFLRQR